MHQKNVIFNVYTTGPFKLEGKIILKYIMGAWHIFIIFLSFFHSFSNKLLTTTIKLELLVAVSKAFLF